jgi:hypothetical protein
MYVVHCNTARNMEEAARNTGWPRCCRDMPLYSSPWGQASPLNNSFLFRQAEIIRILLVARAVLEYVNNMTWTSLSYLSDPDPEFSNRQSICEIFEICCSNSFQEWGHADTIGWTAIHRAAAFGVGQDIRKPVYGCGPYLKQYATNVNWTPIHCAVRYGNESTFEVLAEDIPSSLIVHMVDSRGWTLLYLATEDGSESVMTRLLKMGASPIAIFPPSRFWSRKNWNSRSLRQGLLLNTAEI